MVVGCTGGAGYGDTKFVGAADVVMTAVLLNWSTDDWFVSEDG